jgi:hypothetical protein
VSKKSRNRKLRSMTKSQKQEEESDADQEGEEFAQGDNLEDSVEKLSLKSLSKKFNSIQVDYDEGTDGQNEEDGVEPVEGFD